MTEASTLQPPDSSPDRLDSWKEIAAYLRRDVTTVQRWEKREDMPVHRHQHDRMGSVNAFRHELDAWSQQRSSSPAEPSDSSVVLDVDQPLKAEQNPSPVKVKASLNAETQRRTALCTQAFNEKRYTAATTECLNATVTVPANHLAWYWLARSYASRGEWTDAANAASHAAALMPNAAAAAASDRW